MSDAEAAPAGWRQLPLPFEFIPHYTAADLFEAPCNEAALAWLGRMADWPQQRLALWGAAGCGKTHMLHVWAARHDALLLQGPELADQPAPPDRPLAIDEANAAAERPLLHLLNSAAEAGQPVLLAARAAPARWVVDLPDLSSRLRSIAAVEIGVPDDSLLRAILARLLAERQLVVPGPVQDWMLLQLPRTADALRAAASALQHEASVSGRRVTRATALAALGCLNLS